MKLVSELMVLPVPAKQPKAAFAAETGWMAHRLADFEVSRANAGVTVERVSLLDTPIGVITISYLEGSASYRDVARTIRDTPTVFDQDMMTRGKVLHGLTEEQQKQKRKPLDTSVLYRAVGGRRQPWHSFVAAIAPGAEDRWADFCGALSGSRREAFEAFNHRNGLSVFCGGRYDGEQGTVACYYLEGSDDTGTLPAAAARSGEFETWFVDEFNAVHDADLRKGLPFPAMGKPWDWVKGERNDVVAPLFAHVTALLGE
jgi:hypothetical protein